MVSVTLVSPSGSDGSPAVAALAVQIGGLLSSSLTDAADWHDRWAPGVIRRLGLIMSQCEGTCQRGHDDLARESVRHYLGV